jgi:hypothetical protein
MYNSPSVNPRYNHYIRSPLTSPCSQGVRPCDDTNHAHQCYNNTASNYCSMRTEDSFKNVLSFLDNQVLALAAWAAIRFVGPCGGLLADFGANTPVLRARCATKFCKKLYIRTLYVQKGITLPFLTRGNTQTRARALVHHRQFYPTRVIFCSHLPTLLQDKKSYACWSIGK